MYIIDDFFKYAPTSVPRTSTPLKSDLMLDFLEGKFNGWISVTTNSKDHKVVRMELAGVKKENLQLNAERGLLTLKATKNSGEVITRHLNLDFNFNSVSAEFVDCVLTVTFDVAPKKEAATKVEIK